jgi:hypothetical protein
MATSQEIVEQNIRNLLGDLQLQLIFAKAQIQSLEQMVADVMAKQKVAEVREEALQQTKPPSQTNGVGVPVE